jgi:hypothetical protein
LPFPFHSGRNPQPTYTQDLFIRKERRILATFSTPQIKPQHD